MNLQISTPDGSFNLTDPDGLLFDEEPGLFVNLNVTPVVFTVRGLRYFAPRFRQVGIYAARIRTRDDFLRAQSAWLRVEAALLAEHIRVKASHERTPAEYSILQAIWSGGLEEAERICSRLDRRRSSALRIVAGDTREPPEVPGSSPV